MPSPSDTEVSVFVDGSVLLMARVTGMDGDDIVQADISEIQYTIYALDDADPTARTPVTGHIAVSLAVADVVYNTLQTGDLWDTDATGYNFAHIVDVTVTPPFTVPQARYLVEYTLTPVDGQPIIVRFLVTVI